jgi:hypothetical protein
VLRKPGFVASQTLATIQMMKANLIHRPHKEKTRRLLVAVAYLHTLPIHSILQSDMQSRTSSSAFLVSSSPIQSTSEPPRLPPAEIPPDKARNIALLAAEPTTALEHELQAALCTEQEKNKAQKLCMVSMQSAMVLNGAYVDLVQGQLAVQEKKKSDKRKGRLVGDGLPRLLTSKDFVNRVTEFKKDAREKEEALQECKASRAEKSTALKEWKELEEARKARNKEIRQDYEMQVKEWEAERDVAKEEHRRPRWTKPTLKGLLFSPIPKPGFAVEPGEKAMSPDSDLEGDNDGLNGEGSGDDDRSEDDLPSLSDDESPSE